MFLFKKRTGKQKQQPMIAFARTIFTSKHVLSLHAIQNWCQMF